MKKVVIFLLLFLIIITSLLAQTYPDWSSYFELDMFFGLKTGIEYRFSEYIGLRASAGLCLAAPTQIVYNLFGVYHVMDFDFPFQIDIEAGFLQCAFDVISPLFFPDQLPSPYTYWNTGLAIKLGYQHNKSFTIGLRGGATVISGYDKGRWREPMILPNIAIEYLLFCM